MIIKILFLAFSSMLLAGAATAESGLHTNEGGSASRRGLITSSSCPYSCQMAGLTSDMCKEWRAGDKCYVEDLSQAPGHRSLLRVPARDYVPAGKTIQPKASLNGRGLVTSSPCPYNCKMAKVSAEYCKSWRAGGQCFVEDFTQAPGHRSRLVVTD